MGNKVIIYDTGQTYEIDSDLIYIPWFVAGRRNGKTLMVMAALEKVKEQSMADTVSEKENIHEPN